MEKSEWEILSSILKKEVESSNLSLLHISIKLGIDKNTLAKYLSGDFSGPEIYVKNHLRKLKKFLGIEENLESLYLAGKKEKSENVAKDDEKKKKVVSFYLVPYLIFFISVFLFVLSLVIFFKVQNTPIVKVKAIKNYVEINGTPLKETSLDIGEYYIKGPALFEKIDKKIKKVLMDEYRVVIKWGK